jgi:hypothetical protein
VSGLHGRYVMRRVNHRHAYRAADGTTDNQAESYFSRFRRMQIGQHHTFGLSHLARYANEAACREDTRRWSSGAIFEDNLAKCARTRPHRDWCGDRQGNKYRPSEAAGRLSGSTTRPDLRLPVQRDDPRRALGREAAQHRLDRLLHARAHLGMLGNRLARGHHLHHRARR